jgi:hypothetical protein
MGYEARHFTAGEGNLADLGGESIRARVGEVARSRSSTSPGSSTSVARRSAPLRLFVDAAKELSIRGQGSHQLLDQDPSGARAR